MLLERTMTTQLTVSFLPRRIEGEKEKGEGKRKAKMTTSVEYHIKDMKYYLTKIGDSLYNFLIPVCLFFAPVKGILITVAAFIIIDTISGIWKSKVTNIPITSRGLSGIVSKMLLYQAAIIATYLLDYYILGDISEGIFGIEGLPVKAAAMLLIFIEMQSINENYKIAKGIDLWVEFKKLLARTREVTVGVKEITTGIKDIKSISAKLPSEEDLDDVFKDFPEEGE